MSSVTYYVSDGMLNSAAAAAAAAAAACKQCAHGRYITVEQHFFRKPV